MKRREFLVATSVIGGGMALSILPGCSQDAPGPSTISELTPWLTISPDDIITLLEFSIVRSPTGKPGSDAAAPLSTSDGGWASAAPLAGPSRLLLGESRGTDGMLGETES